MNLLSVYLLKSVCWITGFALVYIIFLRNERFFMLKRIFLLSGLLISFLFPLITVHYNVILPAEHFNSFTSGESLIQARNTFEPLTAQRKIDYELILLLAYFVGMLILAVKMGLNVNRIWKLTRKSENSNAGKIRIIRSDEYNSSFTFFNYIFISPSVEENELMEILNHELVHVKQLHWLDLLIGEFISLVQWANPFAWIYTRFIRINHEHLADEVALQRSSNPALYKAALLNQMLRSPVIRLSNSFNYSLNNNRFEMMKKVITSPYRKLKVLCVLPVFAIIFYAFAEPEIKYEMPVNPSEKSVLSFEPSVIVSPEKMLNEGKLLNEAKPGLNNENGSSAGNMMGNESGEQTGKDVTGTVKKEDGSPFPDVAILVTGTQIRETTNAIGNFTLKNVPEESMIVFSYQGYLTQLIKPQFKGTMTIKLEKDPDFKPTPAVSSVMDSALVVIDGVISEKSSKDAFKETAPDQIASVSILRGDRATEKYGEKAKKGVIEIMTKKKAAELGIKAPFRRINPQDFPTFQGGGFSEWIRDHIQYPDEAKANNIAGRVTASFTVEADGIISNVSTTGNQVLADAVVKAIKEAPKWEPARNPEGRTPYNTSVTIQFTLPDIVELAEVPFVVVEEMPMYPGGDQALLDFLRDNLVYPQEAKDRKVEGRVIVRFAVMPDGSVDYISVLKGVDPVLDAEAVKLVSRLNSFSPGRQGGKAVPVWYMVPVTFSLPKEAEQKDNSGTMNP